MNHFSLKNEDIIISQEGVSGAAPYKEIQIR